MVGKVDGGTELKVLQIFSEALQLEVDLDTEVIETGILDSIAFVQLLVELEAQFGVKVDVASLDLEDFASVSRIAQFVSATSTSPG